MAVIAADTWLFKCWPRLWGSTRALGAQGRATSHQAHLAEWKGDSRLLLSPLKSHLLRRILKVIWVEFKPQSLQQDDTTGMKISPSPRGVRHSSDWQYDSEVSHRRWKTFVPPRSRLRRSRALCTWCHSFLMISWQPFSYFWKFFSFRFFSFLGPTHNIAKQVSCWSKTSIILFINAFMSSIDLCWFRFHFIEFHHHVGSMSWSSYSSHFCFLSPFHLHA